MPSNDSVRNRTCTTCGMLLDEAGEFHPYVFCLLKKAGRDPWKDLVDTNRMLGIDVTHWPERPPLVKNIRPARGVPR